MFPFQPLLGAAIGGAGAGYALIAAWLSRRPLPRWSAPVTVTAPLSAPVSILKPLSGAEPRLYANLATLCRQTHQRYQIVFGVREADDPALVVVARLRAEFPHCDIALALVPTVHGRNLKVSNLINMLPLAKHDLLVLADSDIAVDADYLARVTAPLADPATGVVTCLYRGHPLPGLWPALGAQFIDDWFAPSVRLAHAGGSRQFAFGATIALRRDALEAIGGFHALAHRLADDYWLGELTRRQGLATVLSDVVVGTDVTETELTTLWSHELRWLRTIRSLNPAGFRFLFITFTWPMLLLALAVAATPLTWALAGIGGLARCLIAGSLAAAVRAPLRDCLLLAEWLVALTGSQVSWRGQRLAVSDAMAAQKNTDSPTFPTHPTQGMTPDRTP
jgi:ceramide glucosyltransferase